MLNLEISFKMQCKPLFLFIKKNEKGFAVGLKDIFFHSKATIFIKLSFALCLVFPREGSAFFVLCTKKISGALTFPRPNQKENLNEKIHLLTSNACSF